MKSLLTFITVVFLFVLFGAALYYGYYAVHYLIAIFVSIEVTTQFLIGSIVVALLAAAYMITASINRLTHSNKQHSLISKKRELYFSVLEICHNNVSELNPRKVASQIYDSELGDKETIELNLIAPKTVLDAYNRFLKDLSDGQSEGFIRTSFSNLLIAMRKDLGNDDRTINIDGLLASSKMHSFSELS